MLTGSDYFKKQQCVRVATYVLANVARTVKKQINSTLKMHVAKNTLPGIQIGSQPSSIKLNVYSKQSSHENVLPDTNLNVTFYMISVGPLAADVH